MKRNSLVTLLLLFISLALYYFESFNNFFYQDDFFNIMLSQKQNLWDAFNLFKQPIMNFYFYRPFSTQLYWTLGKMMFGLSPFGYHAVNFVFFLLSIFFVFKIALSLTKHEKVAFLTSFFYAYSASHFYRLFYLSQFQEFSLAVFAFATIYLFLKKSKWTHFLFLLALTTKESAVMIVPVMLMLNIIQKTHRAKGARLILVNIVILGLYLIARIFYFGIPQGGVYVYDFSPKKILNNYFWYILWSLGLPEYFVNIKIFQLPTILNPKLFTAFGMWSNIVLATFAAFCTSIFLPTLQRLYKTDAIVFISFLFFVLFLLPVAFFPFHKFPYSLTIPLFGISLFLAYATYRLSSQKLIVICILYLGLNFCTYQANLMHHWSYKKALTAKTVFDYFKYNYPQKPTNPNIYFKNTLQPYCLSLINRPHYSQEIAYALDKMTGLQLLYNDESVMVYFEDIDRGKHLLPSSLALDSQFFFK